MFAYMYVCMYDVCVCVCVSVCVCVCMYIYIYMHICVYVGMAFDTCDRGNMDMETIRLV